MIKVYAKKDKPKAAEILIYDYIGEDWYGDGCTAKRIDNDLKALGEVSDISVRINSPGGSVFDGIAIYNMLKSHDATISVVIEGVAASAASIIAMAGDTISMGTATQMMIHNPWTYAGGDAAALRKTADTLDTIRDGMIDAYAERTGLTTEKLIKMCDEETWMGPTEAIENGFATAKVESRADETEEATDKAKALLASFKNVPKDFVYPRMAASVKPSAAAEKPEVIVMTPEEIAAQQAAAVKAAAEKARIEALAAEAHRTDVIRALFKNFPQHREVLDACIMDQGCDEVKAGTKLLAVLGAGAEPLRNPSAQPNIEPGATTREKFVAGAEKAVMARMGGPIEPGNEFNGHTIVDIAAHSLRLVGISIKGMTRDAIARKVLATHSTSDFPILFSNVARKKLRDAYAIQPRKWDKIAVAGSVPDFRDNTRYSLGSFSSLVLKPEGGEYKQGTLGEESASMRIKTKGRYISLTREMIVNDDLNAFGTIARKMGQAAGRTVDIDFWTYLLLNSGLGPTMQDGGTFFNATAITTPGGHANYTSSGTALSAASISAGAAMMARQRDLGQNEYVELAPKILMVSPEKEMEAWNLVNNDTDASQSNPNKKNYVKKYNLEVVTSPYLTGNAWRLFADPQVAEAFEVAFLDGQQEPFIDEEIEFMTDSMNMKVRLDYGIAAIDYRAGHMNAGA